MTVPKLDPTINLGHILMALTIIVGGIWNYVTMDARTQANAANIAHISLDADRVEERVRTLEGMQARADERMTAILTALGRIDARLERMESKEERQ